MAYKSITVVKGSGGYGGPLSITPTDLMTTYVSKQQGITLSKTIA